MNKITSPLKQQMKGPEVANLQAALELLLDRRVLLGNDEAIRHALAKDLQTEHQTQFYGNATSRVLASFQMAQSLPETGAVDEATAKAFNTVLASLGAFDMPAPATASYLLTGQVRRKDGRPVAGARVRVVSGAASLAETVTDPEGKYSLRYQLQPTPLAVARQVIVVNPQGSPVVEAKLADPAQPLETLDLVIPADADMCSDGTDDPNGTTPVVPPPLCMPAAEPTNPGPTIFTVDGIVVSPDRVGVGGLCVHVVDKNIKADVLLAECLVDDRGGYRISFSSESLIKRRKRQPDLQALVYADRTLLAASDIRYNASSRETLNIRLPANAALPSEYETLTSAISVYYDGRLKDLQESEQRKDTTYLANKTGWDARAVAMAALADECSEKGGGLIRPALYYALFRAGLPTKFEEVHRIGPDEAMSVWKKAIAQGVIPTVLEKDLLAARKAFQTSAVAQVLDVRAVPGTSSLAEIASLALQSGEKRKLFAEIYTLHRSDPRKLWDEAHRAFGESTAKRLELDGKLAALTLNNAPVIQRLHKAEGAALTSTLALAQRGYYRSKKWSALFDESVPVPDTISGDTVGEKRARYVETLAAQVRLQFPTACIAEMVRSGEIPLTKTIDERDAVHAFLSAHQDTFEVGKHPIGQYIARNKLTDVTPPVKAHLERLHRVYQIAPSDKAVVALLGRGVESAHQAVRYGRRSFVEIFQDDLGGVLEAERIYGKAHQVYNAVLNMAMSYVTARTAPPLGAHPEAMMISGSNGTKKKSTEVHSTSMAVTAAAPDEGGEDTPGASGGTDAEGGTSESGTPERASSDIIINPTLEGLFASMDYCACEHCKSVLSPAAYLVDLLHFIDVPAATTDGDQNPQAVLFRRRPDIPNLPLTCENTNTLIPYIDVVNETLEYFVAHGGSLGDVPYEYKGGNTDPRVPREELLATPQIVQPEAYAILKDDALFPPPLPFHRSLETLRRYFRKVGVPLHEAMETLRGNIGLDRPADALPPEYAWRDILIERLGVSRQEARLLTTSAASDPTMTLQKVFGYQAATDTDPPSMTELEVCTALSEVKTFARRIVISPDDLVALLRTRFVNPNGVLIPRLERLNLPFATLEKVNDGRISADDLSTLLPDGLDLREYDGASGDDPGVVIAAWIGDATRYARIMGLITIAVLPDENPCSLDSLRLRYADPAKSADPLAAIDLIRMQRFIRLWRKLGWTIEETDRAITALFPVSPDGATAFEQLDNGFRTFLPGLGVALQTMELVGLNRQRELSSLLACWSNLDTYGDGSLYRKMFQTSVARRDVAFDDNGYGEVLTATASLASHRETLQAAFKLTSGELDTIVADHLRFNGTALVELTLENISAIYRRAWLARKLRISVGELGLLIARSGINPFAPPEAPNAGMIDFIRFVQALRASTLKPAEALYLLWNDDLSGTSAPTDAEVSALARTLRAGFVQVEADFAMVEDPNGEIARARLSLVYGASTVDFFFGLLGGTFAVSAAYAHPRPTLEAAISMAVPNTGHLAYDDLRKELSYTGIFDVATLTRLKAAVDTELTVLEATEIKTAFDTLHVHYDDVVEPFFARYPELRDALTEYFASNDPAEQKRSALLADLLPSIRDRQNRQQALAVVSEAVHVEAEFARAILDDAAVLRIDLPPTTQEAALNDFLALRVQGLTVDSGATTLEWTGYVEAPESGFYNIMVEADAGATVTFELRSESLTLAPDDVGRLRRNEDPIQLVAGALYPLRLVVEGVTDGVRVMWMNAARSWEVIPSRYLYGAAALARIKSTMIRFLKAASLASGLKLTKDELVHFAKNPRYMVGGRSWLNALPVAAAPDVATSGQLRDLLRAVLDFAHVKAATSQADERLLAVLEDPTTSVPGGQSLFSILTGCDDATSLALTARFDPMAVSPVGTIEVIRRVVDAYSLVKKVGVPIATLLAAATNEPTDGAVDAFQAALRARYDNADWIAVAKAVNDEMRALRRDALVAHILLGTSQDSDTHRQAIDTPEKLFELFLMDVQMDPCMQTSRVRHALSSVQLFIERCLMNLERNVVPSRIEVDQWKWMKRYRVWEANRKVFLWPENWLEPELRTDASPFFKETMSELLQSDITDDAAEQALLNYLSKLEEVAKLEPCGIHYVEADDLREPGVAHVVSRTSGTHRKYYYRRREGIYWTPWEQIKLDIEDTPVLPVVWNGRLLLFWVKILQEGVIASAAPTADGPLAALPVSALSRALPQVTVKAMLCWSEYYEGKWEQSRTSDLATAVTIGVFPASGSRSFHRPELSLGVSGETIRRGSAEGDDDTDPQLRISMAYSSWYRQVSWVSSPRAFLVVGARAAPVETIGEHLTAGPLPAPTLFRAAFDGSDFLVVYLEASRGGTRHVLRSTTGSQLVGPRNTLQDVWRAPLLFSDGRHAFYVTSAEASLPDLNFGIYPPVQPYLELPPVVIAEPPLPDNLPPSDVLDGLEGLYPVPASPAASTDIRFKLRASGAVDYQGQVVNPSGSISNPRGRG